MWGMNRGAQLLRDWIDRRKLKDSEAASELGVERGTLSNWLCGRRVPGREKAVDLQTHTGIMVAEWSAPPLSKIDQSLITENIRARVTRRK